MTCKLLLPLCAFIVLAPLSFAHAGAADLRNAVHATHGRLAVNTFQNCVRSSFASGADECAPPVQATPAAPPQRAEIGKEERTVYFDFNKFALSAEAVRTLNNLASRLKSDDQVKNAKIVGYADRIGTKSYNDQLSKRRADNVRRYMVSQGFVKGQVVDTRWMGEDVPVTQCPDNLNREQLIACLQQDRRVEVEIEYRK
jgi:OOP family OmpA-OmpF porin